MIDIDVTYAYTDIHIQIYTYRYTYTDKHIQICIYRCIISSISYQQYEKHHKRTTLCIEWLVREIIFFKHTQQRHSDTYIHSYTQSHIDADIHTNTQI